MAWAAILPRLPQPERWRKPAVYAAVVTSFILFGDVLWPLVGHALELALHLLELALEVVESLFDQAVEGIFHVDAYTSQLITAWTGLTVFVALLAYTTFWLRRKYLRLKTQFQEWIESLPIRR